MEYTVIGDCVNVVARPQGIARPEEILVPEATLNQVREQETSTPMEPMTLKGKRLTVGCFVSKTCAEPEYGRAIGLYHNQRGAYTWRLQVSKE